MIEIVCGPITALQVLEEIPFICSLYMNGGSSEVDIMFGVGCKTDAENLWRPIEIATATLPDWIAHAIRDGSINPGASDVFIFDEDRLITRICHEGDIHLETGSGPMVRQCAERWLAKSYRVLRRDEVPPSASIWREIQSVEEAIAGLQTA